MSEQPKLSRRHFLSRSAKVTGGVVSLGLLGNAGRTMAQEETEEESGFESFTKHQGLTVEAMAERIFPADENGPGSTDARVIGYIDKALATHHAGEREGYEKGLEWLDRLCMTTQGVPFVELSADKQDDVLSSMDKRDSPSEWPADADISSRDFLRLVIGHTMEGMFSDPMYGGNHNNIGWNLIGFPGRSPFGYDPPYGFYDMVIPEIEYPPFVPYSDDKKKRKKK